MTQKIKTFTGIDYSLSSPAITILSGESIDIHCVYRDKKHLCSEYNNVSSKIIYKLTNRFIEDAKW